MIFPQLTELSLVVQEQRVGDVTLSQQQVEMQLDRKPAQEAGDTGDAESEARSLRPRGETRCPKSVGFRELKMEGEYVVPGPWEESESEERRCPL